jgi:hypothetical protein
MAASSSATPIGSVPEAPRKLIRTGMLFCRMKISRNSSTRADRISPVHRTPVRERSTRSRGTAWRSGRSVGVGTVGPSGTGPVGSFVGWVAGSVLGSGGPTLPYDGECRFIARVGSSVMRPPRSLDAVRDEP